MTEHPCKDECEHLIALAKGLSDTLAPPAAPGDPAFLNDWQSRAQALLKDPTLASLSGEQALDGLTQDLRQLWLREAYAISHAYMMSPPQGQRKHLADGARIGYPYDRWLKPQYLEQRLDAHGPAPKGWTARTVVFANGMAAITTMLQVYRAFAARIWPRPPERTKGPLSVHWFGGYFEIIKALQLLCDDHHLHGRKHAKQENLCTAVERGLTDLVLIEPVAADIDLEVFDFNAFTKAWKRRPQNRPCVIVIDSSLSGSAFDLANLCRALTPHPPAMVVNIRSGLKLDQEGLELANVGLLSLWAPDDPQSRDGLDEFEHSLRVSRTTLGASLSQDEYAALSTPFFLNKTSLANHAQAVFDNNRHFAQALAPLTKPGEGLFARITHPCLSPAKDLPWAEAPYVNVRYRPDDDSARAFLRAVLEFEAGARNLTLQPGSSFGFRAHRFEMGFARDLKHSTLRIAMGARNGPSRDGVIKLFQDLAVYSDFAALRAAYPAIGAQKPHDRTEEES